jgi:hypothetical protein
MLTLADVNIVCEFQRGIKLGEIEFHTVYLNEELEVNKGLFIPLHPDINDTQLKEAINNGAIAALWRIDLEIPGFLPTDFPLFLVKNPVESLKKVIKSYYETNDLKGIPTLETKFIFSISKKHIQQNDSYASAVKEETAQLEKFIHNLLPYKLKIKEGGETEC